MSSYTFPSSLVYLLRCHDGYGSLSQQHWPVYNILSRLENNTQLWSGSKWVLFFSLQHLSILLFPVSRYGSHLRVYLPLLLILIISDTGTPLRYKCQILWLYRQRWRKLAVPTWCQQYNCVIEWHKLWWQSNTHLECWVLWRWQSSVFCDYQLATTERECCCRLLWVCCPFTPLCHENCVPTEFLLSGSIITLETASIFWWPGQTPWMYPKKWTPWTIPAWILSSPIPLCGIGPVILNTTTVVSHTQTKLMHHWVFPLTG